MSSVCISNCVRDAHAPVRATYVNLYKWPESDAEFMMRSLSFSSERSGGGQDVPRWPATTTAPPRVVDSISCRQMYLRSYPFSREEEATEQRAKCFGGGGRRRGRSGGREREKRKEKRRRRRRPCPTMRKARDLSFGALLRIFHKLLSCSASIDVAE